MPVTARLSEVFYDRLGAQIANELVEWYNQVDATCRSDLECLNETDFQRFSAQLDARVAASEARLCAPASQGVGALRYVAGPGCGTESAAGRAVRITSEEETMRCGRVLTVLVLALTSAAVAQEHDRSTGGFDLTAHALWSHQFVSGSSAEQVLGVGVGLGYRLPHGLTVELRSSFRSWDSETYVPLHLGVRYDLPLHRVVTLAPFAGAGPSLVSGNDWASVFASFDVGARVVVALARDSRVRLSFEAGYGRAMAFHPSEFGVLNLGGGVVLSL